MYRYVLFLCLGLLVSVHGQGQGQFPNVQHNSKTREPSILKLPTSNTPETLLDHQVTSTSKAGNKQTSTSKADNQQTSTSKAEKQQTSTSKADKQQTSTSKTGDQQTSTSKVGDQQTSTSNAGNQLTSTFKAGNRKTSTSNAVSQKTTASVTGNEKTSISKTGNEKTSTSKTGNEKTSTYKTGNEKTSTSKTGNEKTSTSKTGNEKTSTSKTGNEKTSTSKTGNEKTSTSKTGKEKTSTSKTGNEKTSTSKTGNEKTSTSKTGNEKTSTSKTGNKQTSTSKTGKRKTSTSKTGNQETSTSKTGKQKTSTSRTGNQKTSSSQTGKQKTYTSNAGNQKTTNSNVGNQKTSTSKSGKKTSTSNAGNHQTTSTTSNTGNHQTTTSTTSNAGNQQTSSTTSNAGNQQTTSTTSNAGNQQTTNTTSNVGNKQTAAKKPAIMSSSMWLAQMSTMGRPYSVRYNENPLPDRSTAPSTSLACPDSSKVEVIYRTLDGSCNNRNNPTLGQSFRSYKRYIQPHYSDIKCLPRTSGSCKKVPGQNECQPTSLPSARTVSQAVHTEGNNTKSDHSLIFNAWAHFISHDLSATGVEQTASSNPCCNKPLASSNEMICSDNCFPISIVQNPTDRYFKSNCMEYVRSLSSNADINNPREQLNLVTPFLDASTVYGSDQATLDKLRGPGGMFKITPDELLPPGRREDCILTRSSHCFAAGDERVNQSPELAMIHLAMVNFHNVIVEELIDTGWRIEKIFQETKKIINALIQRITYTDFLPEILNPATLELHDLIEDVYVYENNTDPQIANVFSTAAFQFIHSLTPESITFNRYRRIPLKRLFNNPRLLFRDADLVAEYMASTAGEKMDRFFTKQLTDHYFQTGQISFDLVAQIIQRGRDHGLPGYTKFRKECGLPSIRNFSMITAGVILQTVYNHVDDVDVFVGGMTEDPIPGTLLGPTFTCLVAKQFRDTKFGDSHWYETTDPKKGFNKGQLRSIKATSAAKVLCEGLDLDFIPRNPFKIPSPINPMINCGYLPDFDVKPWLLLSTTI